MARVTKELIITHSREYLKEVRFKKIVSLSALLKAIGVSKGVFYYYFKDKEELLYEIIIPDIKQKELEVSKKISKFPTLRERLHFMFGFFTDKKLADELNELENFYLYLLHHTSESKFFVAIYDKIQKSRKSLILQQIRYFNIKITRDIMILVDYVDDTMIFYHIFNKKIRDKAPKREIIAIIDVLCRLIENTGKKSAKKRKSKQNAIDS